jgi:hypothetical protein
MASTYEPIATTTLTGAASSVTFSSISGSYTDIILVMNMKSAGAGSNIYYQLNGDTGSNYSTTYLNGDGSSAASSRSSNQTSAGATWTYTDSSQWTTSILQFNNYSNSTTYKTVLGRNNSTVGDVTATVSLWRSTAAITSIKLIAGNNDFGTGSMFTLYGIKAA